MKIFLGRDLILKDECWNRPSTHLGRGLIGKGPQVTQAASGFSCPGSHGLSQLREGKGKDLDSPVRYLKAGWAPVPVTATLLNMGKETL